jgi:uncharacterized membrane protein YbhN (UPF0104 family)
VSLNDILNQLRSINLLLAWPFFLFFLVAGALRGLRLKLLLGKFKIRAKDAIALTYLSQFLSFLIPLRAGEMTKSVYLTTEHKLPLHQSIILIFIDRFLDLWMYLILIALMLPFTFSNLPKNFTLFVGIILAILTILLILAIKSSSFLKELMVIISRVIPSPKIKNWFIEFTHKIIEGFVILERHPFELLALILITFIACVADGFICLAAFRFFVPEFSLWNGVLGNAISAFTFLIPSAPGYIGSTEAMGQAVFAGILGFPGQSVSSSVVLNHILIMICLVSAGIASLYFLKFDLSNVWKRLKGE